MEQRKSVNPAPKYPDYGAAFCYRTVMCTCVAIRVQGSRGSRESVVHGPARPGLKRAHAALQTARAIRAPFVEATAWCERPVPLPRVAPFPFKLR
jgi:hypothetical protein